MDTIQEPQTKKSAAEPVRLVCGSCDTVHRVKQVELGKLYRCKRCRSGLKTLGQAVLTCPICAVETEAGQVDVSQEYRCPQCENKPAMRLSFPPPSLVAGRERESLRPLDAPPVASEVNEEQITQLLHEVVVTALGEVLPLAQAQQADLLAEHAKELQAELTRQVQAELRESSDVIAARLQAELAAGQENAAETELDLSAISSEIAAQHEKTVGLLREQENQLTAAIEGVLAEKISTISERLDGVVRQLLADNLGERIGEVIQDRLHDLTGKVEAEITQPLLRTIEEKIPAAISELQGEGLQTQMRSTINEVQLPLLEEINSSRASVPSWVVAVLALPVFLLLGLLFMMWETNTGGQGKTAAAMQQISDDFKVQRKQMVKMGEVNFSREADLRQQVEDLKVERKKIENALTAYRDRAEMLELKLRIQGNDPDIPSNPQPKR